MRGVPRARRAISQAPSASTLHAEDPGRSGDDVDEVLGLVVVEAGDEPEAIAQRPGDRARSGGGAHEREPRQIEPDRPGRGALAEHDVDLEVLHGRIEDLLDDSREAVDLVDEEHVALAELAEHGGEITGALDGGA